MSDQFKKTYISAREFVNSWEKEVYELTFLDYFIYLLINDLSSLLENNFFSVYGEKDTFRLSKEEIATMSFNLGDSLQIFLDKNCFGGCNLGCPNKLSKPFSKEDDETRIYFVTKEFDGLTASCTNREDCLYYDVKNYVVLDVLMDYYNYEVGIVLHEKDRKLSKLIEFVMNHVILFTRNMGPDLLSNPSELAADLFEKHLQTDETSWAEIDSEMDEDEADVDEAEVWKVDHNSLNIVFADFEEDFEQLLSGPFSKKVIKYFKTFLYEYMEVNKINEIEFEYIDEFLSVLLLQNFIMDENVNFEELFKVFSLFFTSIDQRYSTNFSGPFRSYAKEELNEIKRTFVITQRFQKKHSYLDFILNIESNKDDLIEGYYEITNWTESELMLFDVDVKTEHNNINLGELANSGLKIGDILHLQLNTSSTEWEIAYLELVYPSASKYFLY